MRCTGSSAQWVSSNGYHLRRICSQAKVATLVLRFSPGGSPAHTDAMGGGTLCYDLERSSDGGDGGVRWRVSPLDGWFMMVGFCSQALVAIRSPSLLRFSPGGVWPISHVRVVRREA